MFTLHLKITARLIKMNKFDWYDGDICWYETSQDVIHINGFEPMENTIRKLFSAPKFQKFIGQNGVLLSKYKFEPTLLYNNGRLEMLFESCLGQFINVVFIIGVRRGYQKLTFSVEEFSDTLAKFKKTFPRYFETCDKINALEVDLAIARENIARLAAENAELRAENLKLRQLM